MERPGWTGWDVALWILTVTVLAGFCGVYSWGLLSGWVRY